MLSLWQDITGWHRVTMRLLHMSLLHLFISDILCIDGFFPHSRVSSSVVAAEVSFFPFSKLSLFRTWPHSCDKLHKAWSRISYAGLRAEILICICIVPPIPLASALKLPSRSYSEPCDEQWPGYTTSYSLHTGPTSFEQYVLLILDQQTVILQFIPCRVRALDIEWLIFH